MPGRSRTGPWWPTCRPARSADADRQERQGRAPTDHGIGERLLQADPPPRRCPDVRGLGHGGRHAGRPGRRMRIGKGGRDGLQPIMGSVNAYYKLIHRLGDARTFEDWAMVADMPAGPRQAAFDYAPFATPYP